MIHVVLLSGGSGSRLWPLSNSARSKQFLKVLQGEDGAHISMVQRVFGQISRVEANVDITIATSASQETSIRAQVEGGYALVVEPERRDTAPAIMLACAHLDLVQGAAADDVVVVMPIDTFADQGYYNRIAELGEAVQSGIANLVLLGVEPTYPSEKFGYVLPDNDTPEEDTGSTAMMVREFKEKPDEASARGYIEAGALWNCGVFAFRLEYMRNITAHYLDAADFDEMVGSYGLLPKNSFDYEVVEKADSVAVVPYSGVWKDLGTWNTLCEEMSDPARGRAVIADVENVHVINETALPMVVAGLRDAVVVATQDGILACSKEASVGIKKQVEAVSETRPMYERRRWGEYRVLDSGVYPDGRRALTKELVIAKGAQLSYQRHEQRSEVWTVVSGLGEIVLDGEVAAVASGSVVDIQPMQMHAVRAISELHIIEVQLGSLLVEEDIERFGVFWDE